MTDLQVAEAEAREAAHRYWQETPSIQSLNSWSSFSEGAKFGARFVRATEAARYRGLVEAGNKMRKYLGNDSGVSTLRSCGEWDAALAALAENPAPTARYRDEALVERVANQAYKAAQEYGETLHEDDYPTRMKREMSFEDGWRAALAVIAEQNDGEYNSVVPPEYRNTMVGSEMWRDHLRKQRAVIAEEEGADA